MMATAVTNYVTLRLIDGSERQKWISRQNVIQQQEARMSSNLNASPGCMWPESKDHHMETTPAHTPRRSVCNPPGLITPLELWPLTVHTHNSAWEWPHRWECEGDSGNCHPQRGGPGARHDASFSIIPMHKTFQTVTVHFLHKYVYKIYIAWHHLNKRSTRIQKACIKNGYNPRMGP